MTQRITQMARHASFALILVSLALLAMLAYRVHAQETGEAVTAMPPVGAALNDTAGERRMAQDGARAQIETMRANGATPAEVQEAMAANREAIRTGSQEERQARMQTLLQQRDQRVAELKDHRDGLRERIETRKQEMEQRRDTYRARLSEDAQARVGQAAQGVGLGMTNALVNLENIAGRIQTRITAYESEGLDVTDAVSAFSGVNDLVAAARDDIAAFQELAQQTAVSEDPKADMTAVRDAAAAAKASIRLVHEALTDTVTELKRALALRDEADAAQEASTTDSVDQEATTEETPAE